MNKAFVVFFLLFLASSGKSIALQENIFGYDAVMIDNQMNELDQLEEYLLVNPGTTLDLMTAEGHPLASLISTPDGINLFSRRHEQVLGIPGFFWGCLGGWVGILVVYLNGQDPHEIKQATIGCIAGSVAVAGCYAAYIVWIATIWSFYNFN